jgi:hypothetical protein
MPTFKIDEFRLKAYKTRFDITTAAATWFKTYSESVAEGVLRLANFATDEGNAEPAFALASACFAVGELGADAAIEADRIVYDDGVFELFATCEECGGEGKVTQICGTCHGFGCGSCRNTGEETIACPSCDGAGETSE